MKPMPPEELERLIHRELRGLPVHPAPAGFESRVLAEIERRASIPWYHMSWSYWPAPVRALFLAFVTAFASGVIGAMMLLVQGTEPAALAAQFGQRLGWIGDLVSIGAWGVKFIGHQLTLLPPIWLYGTAALLVACYATFIGLGATAYRVLHRHHD